MFRSVIHKKWILIVSVIVFSLAVIASYNSILRRQNTYKIDIYRQNESQIISANLVLSAYLDRFSNDISLISSQAEKTAEHGLEKNEDFDDELKDLLIDVLEYNSYAYQIRILTPEGFESIRYDRKNGIIREATSLQYKGDRYYFIETLDSPKERIYYSPIDLNIEFGEVEVPYVPTVRLAKKLYADEELYGVIVVNFNIKLIIEQLKKFHEDDTSQLEILNSEGYWLSNSNEELEWGFMFTNKSAINMKNYDLNLWNNMVDRQNDRLESDDRWASVSKFDFEGLESLYLVSSVGFQSFFEEKRPTIIGVVLSYTFLWLIITSAMIFGHKAYNDRVDANKQLEEQALNDVLTGIPNRLSFNKDLHEMIHQNGETMFALFFLDLDGFKSINDQYGHEIGDFLLKDVANRLKRRVRETDKVYRLGGDEFTLIIDKIKRKSDVEIVAKKIIETISHRYVYDDIICRVGVSIGISVYPIDAKTENGLLNLADHNMYEIKKTGKNHYYYIKEEDTCE
jgi:diguanylate cyclase (GGDEF)-like protein